MVLSKVEPFIATRIMRDVCAEFGITRDDLLGRCAVRRIVAARRKFCHECRAAGMSMNRIGQLLGRDHSTVLHHLRSDLIVLPPRVKPKERRVSKTVAKSAHKADYTWDEIDRMTRRKLGRAWD